MLSTIDKVQGNAYDYVIIGGGTAGLVLASRLSEDPQLSVLVLEAGPENIDDQMTRIPGNFGRGFGNPQYDYGFKTVPQKHSDNTEVHWPRGKGLGGSSAVNFYVWNKPRVEDINAIEELGNPGWSWQRFIEYSKKAETFHPPSKETGVANQLMYQLEHHGHEGPIATGFVQGRSGWDVILRETLNGMNVKTAEAPFAGKIEGSFCCPLSIDSATNERSSSVQYLKRASGRPNLTVLAQATVSRILSAEAKDANGNIVATGVEFYYDGKIYSVEAKKEVLLCAGAIMSPQILELSGIGDPAILSKIGIESKVQLSGVGTNVQEHILCFSSHELKESDEFQSLDPLNDPEVFQEQLKLYPQGKGLLLLGPLSFFMLPLNAVTPDAETIISTQEQRLKERLQSGMLRPGLRKQYEIQMRNLKEGACNLEFIASPFFGGGPNIPTEGKKYVSMAGGINHPWSRGTIHATSTDPFKHPEIDPQYFEEDIDLTAFLELMKFIRRISTQQPLNSCLSKELNPGPSVQTDEELKQWIKQTIWTTFHTAGSCSMLPWEDDGVVDSRLKVYGTANIRVVDLSVLPLHVSSHTQTVVYGLAEQAADIIKGVI